jgi:hypothetical protein
MGAELLSVSGCEIAPHTMSETSLPSKRMRFAERLMKEGSVRTAV